MGAANYCLQNPAHVIKDIGDECSAITVKRSNINPNKVRDPFNVPD
jgi:hypothetical protein